MTTDTDQPPTVLQLFSSQLFSLFSTDDNHQVSFSVNFFIFYRYRATSICALTIFFSTITCYSPFFYGYQPPPTMLQLFYFLLISTNQIPTSTWHGISQLELFKVRSHKKKTILFGNFSQHGGGVFPNPKTFVNLPSIFLYAKLGPKWPQMVKNMLY